MRTITECITTPLSTAFVKLKGNFVKPEHCIAKAKVYYLYFNVNEIFGRDSHKGCNNNLQNQALLTRGYQWLVEFFGRIHQYHRYTRWLD